MKYRVVDCYRPIETRETAGTTGDLKYSEVGCYRPVETRETTRDCRDDWGLEIQRGRLLETCIETRETTGDCRDHWGLEIQ